MSTQIISYYIFLKTKTTFRIISSSTASPLQKISFGGDFV